MASDYSPLCDLPLPVNWPPEQSYMGQQSPDMRTAWQWGPGDSEHSVLFTSTTRELEQVNRTQGRWGSSYQRLPSGRRTPSCTQPTAGDQEVRVKSSQVKVKKQGQVGITLVIRTSFKSHDASGHSGSGIVIKYALRSNESCRRRY